MGWHRGRPTYELNLTQTDIFATGATHMALAHNSIIRGFNSIYLQAAHVKDADKKNFVGYAKTWHHLVTSHSEDEEANLFPKIEELLGDKNIWTEAKQEHGMEANSSQEIKALVIPY